MKYKKGLIFIFFIICLFSIDSVCASDANDTLVSSEDMAAIKMAQSYEIDEITSSDDIQVMEQSDDEEMGCEGNVGPLQELQNNTVNSDSTLKSDGNHVDCATVENDYLDIQRLFDDSDNHLSDGSSTGQSVDNIYGIVDLGSNVMSLNIFKEKNGKLELILSDNRESITAIYTEDNALTQEGINQLIMLLNEFDGIMDSNNVTVKYFFATSSLRKLDNRYEVVVDVKNALGIDVHILSEEDEARAGFDAVKFLDLTSDVGLLIDLGGGSSEFVSFMDKSPVLTESMPIGSRSCYVDYVSSLFPNETEIINIQNRVEMELSKLRVNNSGPFDDLYGNGGTIFTVRQLFVYLGYIDNETYVIPSSMMDELLAKLLENTTECYRIISDVAPDRMNTLIPGIVIAIQISNHFQVKNIHFCKGRLEEGIVYELIKNNTSANGTFEELQDEINATGEGGIIYLNRNYVNDGSFSSNGINITKAITIEGNGFTIDASGFSRIFNINAVKNVVLKNITFKGGLADNGGAVIFNNNISDCIISNCSFFANNAYGNGGALYFKAIADVTIENTIFNFNDAAGNGGAINVEMNIESTLFNRTIFISNTARKNGGAINVNADVENTTIANSEFRDNVAISATNNIAINGDGAFILENVDPENIGPFYVAYLTLNITDSAVYGETVEIIVIVEKNNHNPLNDGIVSISINGKNQTAPVENGTANFTISNLNAGSYNCVVSYDNGVNYTNPIQSAAFTVSKQNAIIAAKNAVYVINYDGKYNVVLKDTNGKLIPGKKVIFTLNGKNIGSASTNVKGIATITLTAKILKTAKAGNKNLLIKFVDLNYAAVSRTVKITINKEKTNLVAKNIKFKKAKKVKKYTVTLKAKGKPIKNVKITLKIKGKTYNAKTNKKGKAVFKIKNLTKKGKYLAVINFKGNKYYNAKTVKSKIMVR